MKKLRIRISTAQVSFALHKAIEENCKAIEIELVETGDGIEWSTLYPIKSL